MQVRCRGLEAGGQLIENSGCFVGVTLSSSEVEELKTTECRFKRDFLIRVYALPNSDGSFSVYVMKCSS